MMLKVFYLGFLFGLSSFLFAQNLKKGVVIVVQDGDTVVFVEETSKDTLRIRLHGVDAPEKVQAFGKESKAFTSDFCLNKVAELDSIDTDVFGRRVGKIRVNQVELNQELLRQGLAWHFKRYSKKQSDSALYAQLEAQAQKEKKGLWSQENPIAPWKYRSELRQLKGKVIGIRDGDSIELLIGEDKVKVDFRGIDCPEYAQNFGKEAVQFTRTLCIGKEVSLRNAYETHEKEYTAELVLADGRNVNEVLIQEGLAWCSPSSKNKKLTQLETTARQQKKGLWIDTQPTPPWVFRKQK